MSFSITVWYGKLTSKDKNKMKKIVETASRRKAHTVSLNDLYNNNVMKQVGYIES